MIMMHNYRFEDADCDGILADDDCDDELADSTIVAEDADCDGVPPQT